MSAPAPTDALGDWLRRFRRPMLVSHRRPDGDAIGALAAASLAARRLGAEPVAVLFEPFPARYALLEPLARWHVWRGADDPLHDQADALVILDTCALGQLEPIAEWLTRPAGDDAGPACPPTLVIDHHVTRDAIGVRPGDLRVIDERAGACCLILAEWAAAQGATLPISRELATALLVGVATDCGWFRFSNTDARMLRAAAALVDAGADVNCIFDHVYQQDPPARLRLAGRMLAGLELRAAGRLVVLRLRRADFAACEADESMTEDLVNEAGRIAGTEATVLFTEQSDGVVRVNLRSKRAVDVAAIARRFGGGGHVRAAGARVAGAWEQVTGEVIGELERSLSEA